MTDLNPIDTQTTETALTAEKTMKVIKPIKPNIPANPFILVDGSSYLFRAFHALPPLTTTKGQHTGAIFGVANMLRKLINDYKPEHMAVVFDSKEKNFRHVKYPDYKANRTVMPEELQQQIEPLFSLIKAMGLPLIVVPGVEADDIIGTLARQAKEKGIFTLISTGDKDFAQLVDDKTYLINTMSQEIYDRKRVIEKFEIPPESILDYFALIGDSVDNIPGVPKVGPKTAVKWLDTYKTLDNIIQNANEFPGKVGENLRATLDKLPLFKELVTIDVHIPLNISWETIVVGSPQTEILKNLYTELEFRSWLKALLEQKSENERMNKEVTLSQETLQETSQEKLPGTLSSRSSETHPPIIVTTEEILNTLIEKLKKSKQCVIDIYKAFPDNEKSLNVGLAFRVLNETYYLPLCEDKGLESRIIFARLKPILEDPEIIKTGHTLKNIAVTLANQGIQCKGMHFDVMLESYILNATGSKHDIHTLAERFLHVLPSYETIAGKGAKQKAFNEIAIETQASYANDQTHHISSLHELFWPQIQAIDSLHKLFADIEMPLSSVLAKMQHRGVLIDAELLKKQSKELQQKISLLEQEVFSLAGGEFNLNSPKQLQEVLYQRLKCPVLEKTPTGQPSTAESVMQELALTYPLPKMILEYRSLSKLKSTYTDKLPNEIDLKTGRVHTSYHQAITSTGRLSSSDPNLQNIPIRTKEGRKIRSAFIASPGYKIVAADYSQIELRIMAHMSQDPGLLQAFTEATDIHVSTAASVFGIAIEAVTFEQRRSAKAINFGLIYGMSSFGLAKQLGIERFEADVHIEKYFASFPKVKAFMEETLKQGKAKGYVETLFGRRLYLPELNNSNIQRRKAAERAAVNAPMQGTNADIIKLAMIELDKWAEQSEDKVRMIMQVHDELVFEIHESILEEAIEKIKYTLENIVTLSVKLEVGIGVGNNWEEAHGE